MCTVHEYIYTCTCTIYACIHVDVLYMHVYVLWKYVHMYMQVYMYCGSMHAHILWMHIHMSMYLVPKPDQMGLGVFNKHPEVRVQDCLKQQHEELLLHTTCVQSFFSYKRHLFRAVCKWNDSLTSLKLPSHTNIYVKQHNNSAQCMVYLFVQGSTSYSPPTCTCM